MQGDVREHIEAVKKAMIKSSMSGEAILVDGPEQLDDIDGIIIPGGESTTIGKLLKRTRTYDRIKQLAESGLPILGTCAGLVVLAKLGGEQVSKTGQPLLGLVDMEVVRNAFGR